MLTKRPASDKTFSCYRCGEQGHTVRNCPKIAKTYNSVNLVILNENKSGISVLWSHYHIINDGKYYALLDTGAERTCLDLQCC